MFKKVAALMMLAAGASQLHAADQLVVVSFGGDNKKAQESAFYDAFSKESGVAIQAGEYNGEMAKIKVMADTGKTSWDVVEVETPELVRGCSEGLFERLDWPKLGKREDFIDAAVSECGAGIFIWSTVLSYDTRKLSRAPNGWADFWDVETFPGKRGLRRGAKFTLEFALLADGVKAAELYKVLATKAGVDRAFAKLDQIKPYIQWWEAGAQPLQWLAAGDVVMTSAYNGRVTTAQREGSPFAIQWNGSVYDLDHWAIVKGSPRKALAERFIALASRPDRQGAYVEQIPYGPTNLHALEHVAPQVRGQLPTAPENLENALAMDTEFWIDHGEELEQRFNAWINR